MKSTRMVVAEAALVLLGVFVGGILLLARREPAPPVQLTFTTLLEN